MGCGWLGGGGFGGCWGGLCVVGLTCNSLIYVGTFRMLRGVFWVIESGDSRESVVEVMATLL